MADIRRLPFRIKSGSLAPGAFSGTPKVASVVFGSPFAAVYSVTVDIETSGNRTFVHSIQTLNANGFVINLCADTLTGLVRVNWQAIAEGEN
jgi:hypothetical protein